MGRFYRGTTAIWSYVFFPPQSIWCLYDGTALLKLSPHSCLWERISEITRIVKRKWFPCAVHQGVTILFFHFHQMAYFFFKWHDRDATHCHRSSWWQTSSPSWITDITETHKNVLTFLTHNDTRLIVSSLDLSKNICEKIVQCLSHNWQWLGSRL